MFGKSLISSTHCINESVLCPSNNSVDPIGNYVCGQVKKYISLLTMD